MPRNGPRSGKGNSEEVADAWPLAEEGPNPGQWAEAFLAARQEAFPFSGERA